MGKKPEEIKDYSEDAVDADIEKLRRCIRRGKICSVIAIVCCIVSTILNIVRIIAAYGGR